MQTSQRYSSLEQSISYCERCGDQSHTVFSLLPQSSSPKKYLSSSELEARASNGSGYTIQAFQQENTRAAYQSTASTFTYAQNLQHYLNAMLSSGRAEYHSFEPFLKQYRPQTQFIGSVEAIKEHIKEAFKATAGEELPEDILIQVLSRDELKVVHESIASHWSDTIQGFALNGRERKIFIKENDLDKVMLVIGHELGHVMTPTLPDIRDEEAKAFAFEIAWMQAIVEHNIADLKENISLDSLDFLPAKNGIHDVAFTFVKTLINTGRHAMNIFKAIVAGEVSVLLS